MKTALNLLLVIVFSSAGPALAGSITLNEAPCVDTTAKAAFDSITDYDAYSGRAGAIFRIGDYARYSEELRTELQLAEAVIGNARLLSMVKSQKGRVTTVDGKEYTGVWLVFQPVNVVKGAVYPRFYVKCSVEWKGDTSFVQTCEQDTNKQHYAMDRFHTVLTVEEGACENGKTRLDFKLNAHLNSAHVEAIKREVPRIAAPFFKEVDFFTSYYENFYNGWVQSLLSDHFLRILRERIEQANKPK